MRTIGIFVLVMLLSPTPLAAQTTSPVPSPAPAAQAAIEVARSRIDTMLRTGHADPSWFSASFLAQISAAQVDAVIASVSATLGAYQSVEYTPTRFIAHFAKGTDDILIHLDGDNKIDGLIFRPPSLAASSLDGALQTLRSQPGMLAYVIEEGRSERAALNASQPLAIGSAFKLAVLNALRDAIARGTRHWTDVVPLASEWKSLPSGILQTWPTGTPLTLATYAAQMISISDNTAADSLIHILGQSALRPYADGNVPFLTTREAFTLKSETAASLRGMYLTVDGAAARASLLRRIDAMPLPSVHGLSAKPTLAVEWHYSVRQLCALMARVADLPLMSINPGVANASSFAHVAYKGGSDLGVVNLTTMVTTRRGTKVCFSATLNDPQADVDETRFELVYASVLQQLAAR